MVPDTNECPAKSFEEQPPRRGLTIRQLVARSGVTALTVHHYVAIGLLPEPERPHRWMAYYDPACVERIAQIKTLQTERFLPLGVIQDCSTTAARSAFAKPT